jgi:hypothetical protein
MSASEITIVAVELVCGFEVWNPLDDRHIGAAVLGRDASVRLFYPIEREVLPSRVLTLSSLLKARRRCSRLLDRHFNHVAKS